MDFSHVSAAGISAGEAAYLFGVSRVMYYKWRKPGGSVPGLRNAPRVERILQALAKATEAGDLPLPAGTPTREVKPGLKVRPQLVVVLKKYWH